MKACICFAFWSLALVRGVSNCIITNAETKVCHIALMVVANQRKNSKVTTEHLLKGT